jgi:UDP-N-acetylmuramoyl-tripeptide--D-alanyl-D-alanine ligase
VGEHWVPSVLGVLAAAVSCGMDLKSAAAALECVEPHRARLEPVVLPSGAIMLRDDFNPTVQSLPAALRVLEQAQAPRRLLALSDVSDTGQEVDQRYRELGGAVARSTDVAIFFGEHCRRGADAALAAGMKPESVHAFPGWQEAASFLNSELRKGDLVLLRCFVIDHPERIFFAQFGTLQCTKPKCLRIQLCDYCKELRPSLERAAEAPAPVHPFWMPRALHL